MKTNTSCGGVATPEQIAELRKNADAGYWWAILPAEVVAVIDRLMSLEEERDTAVALVAEQGKRNLQQEADLFERTEEAERLTARTKALEGALKELLNDPHSMIPAGLKTRAANLLGDRHG